MITQGLGTTSTTHDLFTDDSSVTDSDENVAVIVACIVVVVMFVVVVVVVVVFRRTHLWRRLRLYLSVVCLKYSGPKLPNVATYGIDNLSFPGEIKDDCTYDEIDDQTLEKADTPHKAGTLVRPPMKLPIKKCESSDGYLVPVSARKPDVSDLKGPEASGIYIEILDGDDVVTDITDKPDDEGSSVDVSMRVADKECDTEEPTGDYRAFTDVRSSGTLGRPPMKLHIRKCEPSGGYFVPVSARKPDGDDVVTDVTNKPDDEGSSVDISMGAADKDCDTEEPTGSYKAFTDVKSTGVQPSASTPSDECLDITQVGSASEYLDLDTPGNIM